MSTGIFVDVCQLLVRSDLAWRPLPEGTNEHFPLRIHDDTGSWVSERPNGRARMQRTKQPRITPIRTFVFMSLMLAVSEAKVTYPDTTIANKNKV